MTQEARPGVLFHQRTLLNCSNMDPTHNSQSYPPSGYSPIYNKTRKTGRKKEGSHTGGVAKLMDLFESKSTTSSYVISKHGEQRDISEGLLETDQLQSESTTDEPKRDEGTDQECSTAMNRIWRSAGWEFAVVNYAGVLRSFRAW